LTATPLFETARFQVHELQRGELPALQALFEANPQYFITVGGQGPRADEAVAEYEELPPPHLSYSGRWFTGFFDAQQALGGMAIVLSDLCAGGVWHVALFILADDWHGTGAARELYNALEAWAARSGATWMRLGVVQGNVRAERFWRAQGFAPVRTRPLVNASGQPKTVHALIKPLHGGTLAQYLQLVPRDHPASTLP
jgi:GNAT superfamily N-acetyltransferase